MSNHGTALQADSTSPYRSRSYSRRHGTGGLVAGRAEPDSGWALSIGLRRLIA